MNDMKQPPTKPPLKRRWYLLVAAVLLILSCDIATFGAPQEIPTSVPGAIDLMVAQTAGAAATQTAAMIPPTATLTLTPLPTLVPQATPTITPTFIFIVFTPTKLGGARGYSCNYISQYPKDGTNMNGKTAFTGKWKVTNDGGIAWDPSVVDFIFIDGTNFGTANETPLPTKVGIGDSITLSVSMIAPNRHGKYTTIWSLRAGVKAFCSLSMTIKVN